MSFIDGFSFYFRVILDLTTYIVFFWVSLGFCALLWKKPTTKKEILKFALLFLGSYATCILFSALMFAVSRTIMIQLLSQMVFSISTPVIVLAFSLIFLKGRKLHHFIKTIILVSSTVVVDVLSKNMGFFVGNLAKDMFFIIVISRSAPYVFFALVCFLLNRIDINHYRNLSKEMVVIISVLSSLLIVAGVYEHVLSSQETATTVLLSFLDIVLLFVLNFSYYATYKNIEHRHKITNLEVQKTLEDAERMSIAIDQNNREELEKLRHDIKNQFSYLGAMLQQGKNEEAKQYVDDYLNTSNPVLNSFSCSNNVINSIINLELTKAKIKGIKIDVKVVVPPLLPFKDIDLVSLLTNIIDNAIENYYSEEKDQITVRIMKHNDFIRFLVSNPINPEKVSVHSLTTTRKVGRGHGYGTKIIKNIASAYNGYVDFSVEDNRFVCDAVLNLNTKEQNNA